MDSTLIAWAHDHGIPRHMLDDLHRRMHADGVRTEVPTGAKTEAGASKHLDLAAANAGDILWRNNVGATPAKCRSCGVQQTPVRYGLANTSHQQNKVIKSSDKIGIRRVTIEPWMVGNIIGQFVAREVKKPGWKYTGNPHERAQLNFIELVISMGGDACFSTGMY